MYKAINWIKFFPGDFWKEEREKWLLGWFSIQTPLDLISYSYNYIYVNIHGFQ